MEYLAIHECKDFRVPSEDPVCHIEDTPENIAAFIVKSPIFKNYAFVTSENKIKLFSMGQFLDLVLDENDLQTLQEAIIPMQMGEVPIHEVAYVNTVQNELIQSM